MRLVLAVLALALTLAGSALAQSEDLRAPDQQVGPTAPPASVTDLRAPDQQVGPTAPPAPVTDLRAPDQQAPAQTPPSIPAPVSDSAPSTIVYVLIGLGVALALCAGGVTLSRRRRTTIADDLVVE
jgi:hypothetical protein